MWMRNTYLPLSVAFLDQEGRILNIENMQPETEDNHCAREGRALCAGNEPRLVFEQGHQARGAHWLASRSPRLHSSRKVALRPVDDERCHQPPAVAQHLLRTADSSRSDPLAARPRFVDGTHPGQRPLRCAGAAAGPGRDRRTMKRWLLGLERGAQAWVREVALSCDGRDRRLRPHGSPLSTARPVDPLAGTPRQPLARRAALRRCRFHPGTDELQAARLPACAVLASAGTLPFADRLRLPFWARRSHFGFGAQSVLVTEVFSPTLLQFDGERLDPASTASTVRSGATDGTLPQRATRQRHCRKGKSMRIAVLGAGAWGTALAIAFAHRHSVVLWARDPDQVTSMRGCR
jgi:hypothetical protein